MKNGAIAITSIVAAISAASVSTYVLRDDASFTTNEKIAITAIGSAAVLAVIIGIGVNF